MTLSKWVKQVQVKMAEEGIKAHACIWSCPNDGLFGDYKILLLKDILGGIEADLEAG